MTNLKPVQIEDLRNAAKLLEPFVDKTSLRKSHSAFAESAETYFKFENEQKTGSFKIRGAMNKMLSLSSEEKARGVVASSAGNHAQGVAYAAQIMGVKAHIVMPLTTPMVKINATRKYGAEVILQGEFYDEAYAHALKLAQQHNWTFVHPYEDPHVIAGQGTIGLEVLEQLPDVDSVIVPIGGGGLISGISQAIKSLRPQCKVYGVVLDQTAGMYYLKKGQAPSSGTSRISTIAEGIAVKKPSPWIFDNFIAKNVDDIFVVDDDQIAQAMVVLVEKIKTVTEGSGAAGLAALISGQIKNLGKKTCVILCGGNVDLTVIARVVERGLRAEHRLARFALLVDDLPGNLYRLTEIFSQQRANILEVYHDRVSPELGLRETRIDFLIETASLEHQNEIRTALQKAGFDLLKR